MTSIKLLVCPFLCCLFSCIAMAQFGVGSSEEVVQLKSTETLFTLIEGHTVFNAALKDAVEKYWTFTPYRFVDQEELQSLPGDTGLSYVELYLIAVDKGANTIATYEHFNLGLFMSHKKKLKRNTSDMSKLNSIAAVNLMPKKYWEYLEEKAEEEETKLLQKWFSILIDFDESTQWKYARFFEALDKNGAVKAELIKAVQLLNNYCHVAERMDFSENNPRPMIKKYNRNKGQIKKKTLLIAKEDVSTKKKNNQQALKEVYPYDMKIVDQAEIWKAIEEQKEDVCYAVIYYEERNMKLKAIIQAKDSKVLYGEISKLKNGVFHVSKRTLEAVLDK